MIPKRSTATVLVVACSVLLTPVVGAQIDSGSAQDPAESTTTTTVVSTTTSPPTSTPGSSTTSTTVAPGATTTTIYLPPVPPELAADPRLPYLVDPGEDSGLDIPVAQMSFNPLSVGVLPERVAESKLVLAAAIKSLADAKTRAEGLEANVARMQSKVSELSSSRRSAVQKAAAARKRLRDRAVDAYVKGRSDPRLTIVDLSDATDIGVAREYMGVVLDSHQQLAREYEKLRKSLNKAERGMAESLGVEKSKLGESHAEVDLANKAVEDATQQLAAYEAGAHAYVAGFVFPVASEVEFIDSWGYPRMTGTSYQHWHQGTDIFAPYGAPAIASENGVIDRMGTAVLGGNKLWVKGDSGTAYYYAHFAAFAPGLAEGDRVSAGQIVGYVGDTGNAKGTSPHLHFEVHPESGDAVNAYPLLKAAYGNRPMVRATVPVPAAPVPPTPPVPAGAVAATPGG